MFTGLIEKTGRLVELKQVAGGFSLTVGHAPWDEPLHPGESIAVSGPCLTVTQTSPERFACDVLEETLHRTSLGEKRAGDLLNLERALKAGDRFGGHIVTGHIDGTGRLDHRLQSGRDWILRITCEAGLTREMVTKGSVACDGVSLTLTAVWDTAFEVHVIPFTWENTSLHAAREGDAINIETDLIGKHVHRALGPSTPGRPVSLETLRQAGFLDAS
jgi:riboflavin synthase